MIRQAHPGPDEPAYRTAAQKARDAAAYQREEGIPWPVLVDDLEGTVHQAYGGLADPTYLIGRDGHVSFYGMWTHAPTLYRAIDALLGRGGRGVVGGGIDHRPHMLPAITEGWRGIRRGLPRSFTDLETAAPGMATGLWLGSRMRPLLAPLTLRAKPLSMSAQLALAAGATLLASAILRRIGRADDEAQA